MNETLRRALLRARLSEGDVAAHLQVDPKTVRRWLEGRVPYLRHRWALVSLLNADEADLWPEVQAELSARTRPAEIKAVYPNRRAMPLGLWLSTLGLATQKIDILDDSAQFLVGQPEVLALLGSRARAGVRVRISLQAPGRPLSEGLRAPDGPGDAIAMAIPYAHALFSALREGGEVRVHRAVTYNCLCRGDDRLIISLRVFGVAAEHTPIVLLQLSGHSDLAATYLESFERIWSAAGPPR